MSDKPKWWPENPWKDDKHKTWRSAQSTWDEASDQIWNAMQKNMGPELTGDGCAVCNPEYAKQLEEDETEMTTLTEGDILTYRGNEYTVDWVSLDDDGNPHIIGVTGPWGCYSGTIKELLEMGFERK